MNIDIRVLSGVECCSRVSLEKSEGNIDGLCTRLTELLALFPLRTGGSPRIVSRETIGELFTDGGLLVVALDRDSNIVGMGRLVLDCGKGSAVARIEDVVVDRWCWRHGIGRRILACLVELAVNHQVRHVDVVIDPGDVAGNALLDELGFDDDAVGAENVRRFINRINT